MVMEKLIRMAAERGINVEDLIISAIRNVSNDPTEVIRLRLELAKAYLSEAKEYVSRGDAIQASERAHRAAENIVKALAEKYNTLEYQQAIKESRWHIHLLIKAVTTLSNKLGRWMLIGWASAFLLYDMGFHEAKLTVDAITSYIDEVKKMVGEAEKVLMH